MLLKKRYIRNYIQHLQLKIPGTKTSTCNLQCEYDQENIEKKIEDVDKKYHRSSQKD